MKEGWAGPWVALLWALCGSCGGAQFGGIPPPLQFDPVLGGVGMRSIAGLAGVGASGLSAPLSSAQVNPYNSYASYPTQYTVGQSAAVPPAIYVVNANSGGHAKDRGPGWLRCPNFGLKAQEEKEEVWRQVVTDMWSQKYGACSEARKTASELKRRAGREVGGKWAAIVIRDPMYSTCSYSFDHGGEVSKEDMEKVEAGEKANYCMLDIFGCHIFLRKVAMDQKEKDEKKKKDAKKKKDGKKKKEDPKKKKQKKKKKNKKKKTPKKKQQGEDEYGGGGGDDYYGGK